MPQFLLLLVCVLCAPMTSLAQESKARSWAMSDGSKSKPMSIFGAGTTHVRFREASEKRFYTLPIAKLGKTSQSLVKEWKKANSRPKPKSDLQPAITKNQKVPGPGLLLANDAVSVKKLSGINVELLPYGRVSTKDNTATWRVVSRNPPAFSLISKQHNRCSTVTILRPCKSDADRTRLATAVYENVVAQLGESVNDSTRSLKKASVRRAVQTDPPLFFLDGSFSDGSPRQITTLFRFEDDITLVFQASAADYESATNLLVDVEGSFRRPTQKAPDSVVTEVNAVIANLKTLAKEKQTEKLLKEIMPPTTYKRFNSTPERWKGFVKRFESSVPDFLKALEAINWDEAEYDPKTNAVNFPVEPKPIKLKKSNGKWKMAP